MRNGIIEVLEISGAERERLLSLEEDTFSDLKSIGISPKKLSKAISAFANTAGGELYIGIMESEFLGTKTRQWHGFKDIEEANGYLQALSALFPLGAEHSYEFLRAPGSNGLVLHISVQRTVQISRGLDKKIYVRRGAQSLEVKGKLALDRLNLDKGIQSFEKQTVDEDISIISESETIKEFIKQVVPNQTPIQFLNKQRLIRGGKPVVAAVLLFADEPQIVLPKQSGVKLYRYKTRDIGSRDTLADTETLHEIVTNAILHRDYSIVSDVHIKVFDNRIEIESPGLLPGHVTVKNFLVEQFARNGILVRLINKFPYPPNKDIGEGLNTAFRAMHKLRLKPPVVEETNNSVLVKIRHEPLASPEESVMDYLANHTTITNRIAREITGIASENSMKEVFYRLAKSNLIERVPGRKGAAAAWQKRK